MESKTKVFHFYGQKPMGAKKKLHRVAITGVVCNNTIQIGIATCSLKDRFVRKLGRSISTGRAISKPTCTIQATEAPSFVEWATSYCGQRFLPKKKVSNILKIIE